MNKRNWAMIAVFAVIVLLVFFVGVGLLGGWSRGSWGMMGPGMMVGWGFNPLGWLGMLFMWIIPVGIIVLIVVGVAWLVRYIMSLD